MSSPFSTDEIKFTPKESQIRELILQGLSNKEIANRISSNEKTVKFHVTNLYRKTEVTSRAQFLVKSLGGSL